MQVQHAYDNWASQYDTSQNKTRDLEGQVLRLTLENIPFGNCLEIGCGTGKNTMWLVTKANRITSVDISEEMLVKAREKIRSEPVHFIQADIRNDWTCTVEKYDLVSFSLMLEHIENLDHIFHETARLLNAGGHVYIGELHPFKQYLGTKARFETEQGMQVVECYNHHISDFVQAAKKQGLMLIDLNEFFDDNSNAAVPRILTIVLKKA